MRTATFVIIAAMLSGCDSMDEKPVSPPGAAAAAEPSEGRWRMQLDDSLALCLCDMSPGACNGKYQICWHPLESHAPEIRVQLAASSALHQTGRPRFAPIDQSELRFLGSLENGRPICPEGVKGRVGHLRRGIRRAPSDLMGESRHMWDEATYETVAWCGPALGSEVLR